MRSKKVVLNAIALNNNGSRRPFDIGLGNKDIVNIHGIRVFFRHPGNVLVNLTWALIQKNERNANNVPVKSHETNVDDSDILITGVFNSQTDAVEWRAPSPYREMIWFPIPFKVPRSPTLEVFASASGTYTFLAEMFYTKEQVNTEKLTQLLKKWKGRKQDVVSNIPRVIDE